MGAALKTVENPYETDDARWAACLERDKSADGAFWSCVATTGVYCRPSCAGRPLRRNVTFAASRAEAERAGYRPCKRCKPDRFVAGPLSHRLAEIDWARISAALDAEGWARLDALLTDGECARLIGAYEDDALYSSRVVMARHGFGAGEYRYFADPAPPLVAELRKGLYPRLAPIASEWAAKLGDRRSYPASHDAYRRECAVQGQRRPTPLILKYGPGDYNRLHQDLYGEEVFPLQVAILLSEPGKDFEGGEFVLTEQRPRMQSRAAVVPLRRGDAVVFAVNDRPVQGARGAFRAKMRHGVSTVRAGARFTLGIIFHDAA
ncbi:MAG TPA: 2OG-Fe(II) oxygenase [Parvularculaceae bacterium]|nr:2OG-Fe(II) oxygenase [Parvularculaceae bacterium]